MADFEHVDFGDALGLLPNGTLNVVSEDDLDLFDAWDPEKHPRNPAGSAEGGEFASSVNNAPTDTDFKRWEGQIAEKNKLANSDKDDNALAFMERAIVNRRTTRLSQMRDTRFVAIESKTGELQAAGLAKIKGKTAEITDLGSIKSGAGSVALKSLEAAVRERGVTSITLEANSENKSFYERHGYKVESEEHPYSIIMRKDTAHAN